MSRRSVTFVLLSLSLVVLACVWAAEAGAVTSAGLSRPAQNRPQVACGVGHTVAIASDGTLWSTGSNTAGQLGLGDTTNRSTPTQVIINKTTYPSAVDNNWIAVACGSNFTLALQANGTLWAWGNNAYGQLCQGDTTQRTTPTQVGSATTWTSVSCGYRSVAALQSNGTLWVWGNNTYGQLGLGSSDTNVHSVATQFGSGPWTAVACGNFHVLAVQANGTLWSWGYNTYGELGLGDTTQRNGPVQVGSATTWTAVACGADHSAALQSNGYLYDWGYNNMSQLGDGTTSNYLSPRQVDSATNWTAVSCGSYHTMAQKSNGSLWAWGSDSYGEQGDGGSTTQTTPKQVAVPGLVAAVTCGNYATFSMTVNGTLYAWGLNNYGGLGLGDTANRGTPTTVARPSTAPPDDAGWSAHIVRLGVGNGAEHSSAIKSNGELLAWGSNLHGQLGQGDSADRHVPSQVGPDTAVGVDNVWATVASGAGHTLAIKADGTLWAWGLNTYGQLGLNDNLDRVAPVQVGGANDWVAIACGGAFSMALKSNGTLWAWGLNDCGQLGLGDVSARYVPVQVGGANDWVAIACGCYHTLALKSNGTLWAWGYNNYGQLGDTTIVDKHIPTAVSAGTVWSAIAAGMYHSVAIRSDGTLWSWGHNTDGQLGDNTTADKSAPVADYGGGLWNAIACGGFHTVALRSGGGLSCWGYNNNGQVGDGTTASKSVPTAVTGGGIWSAIGGGLGHTVAVRADGSLWSWGRDVNGQLGDGATLNQSAPERIAGLADGVTNNMMTLTSPSHANQSAWYANNSPVLTWSGSDIGGISSFCYWVDHTAAPTVVPITATYVSGATTGVTLAAQADGTWYFHIRPCDASYNWGGTSTYTFNIDTTGPTLGALSSPSHPSVINWYANSTVTCTWAPVSDPTPGIGGTVTYWYSLDKNPAYPPTSSHATFSTTASLTVPADGVWYFHVCAVDALGNVGPTQNYMAKIDTTGPTILSMGSTSHPDPGSWYPTSSVTCLWSETGDPGVGGWVTYWYSLDQNATGNPTSSHATTGTTASLTASADGVWYFHVCAVDALGNVGPTLSYMVKIDTTGPTLGALSSPSHPDPASWYLNSTVTCAWGAVSDPPPGAGGTVTYRYALDQAATTDPTGSHATTGTTASLAASADGVWYFHVCAVDALGNVGPTQHFRVQIDTTPPNGEVTIGDGSGYVNSRTVAYHPSASDLHSPILMQVRNQGDAWPSSWSTVTDRTITLPLGEGYKTVEARYEDPAGNISDTASTTVVYDITPPLGFLWVARGAAAVNSTSTFIETWAIDMNGPVMMRTCNGGDVWSSWTPVTGDTEAPWTLPTGDGPKTVGVQFKDAAGNISLIKQSVILDTTPPAGNMVIDGGIPATYDPSATLALSARDANDPIDMRLRDANGTWGDWQPYDASMAWTLPGADGPKSVEVQYRDVAGNLSAAIPSSIYLDRVAPSTADNSAGVWHAAPFALTLTPSDSGSGTSGGQAKTEYSIDGGLTYKTGTTLNYERWKRGGGSGLYTVWVRSTDAAGNTETAHPLSVMIDTGAPTCSCDAPTGTVAGPLAVTFTGHDALSGVAETWYSLDGGTWTRAASVTVSDAGAHTLRYYAVDGAGNTQVGYSVCGFTLSSGGSGVARRVVVRPRVVR